MSEATPAVNTNIKKFGLDVCSRINPKYKFPQDLKMLERQLRISLGLPFFGKMGGQVAYGYSYNSEREVYEPNQEVFKYLFQARQYLYTSSIREVTDWLNLKTSKIGYNYNVSHMGLRNIMILRPPMEECLLPFDEKMKIISSLCLFNQKK